VLSQRATSALTRGTTSGVVALALAGFAMSYDALHALAREQGVPAPLAWLWPLVVDGFIIVASLSVVRAVADNRHASYPWTLVLAFSAISVAFNVVHAAPTLIARLVAAIPPAALVLSFELLMRQLRAALQPGGKTERAAPADLATTAPTPATLVSPRGRAPSTHASPLLEQARAISTAQGQANRPVTGAALARELGISDGYARRLLRQLAADGRDMA
jgi:hypothetical protein